MTRFLLFLLVAATFLFVFFPNDKLFLWDAPEHSASTTDTYVSEDALSATATPPKKAIPVAKIPEKTASPIAPKKAAPKTATPLVHYGTKAADGALLSERVIEWTNTYRTENKLGALQRNAQLDSAAIIKVHDMFEKQYFAHESPSGKNSADLVSGVGYDYLWVGENLALGIFSDEKDLVDAWMASPGHRANILNSHFEEIGVGVEEGEYEGKHVWIAVQEFGKPASSCSAPKASLKAEIETKRQRIDELSARANTLVSEINALDKQNDTDAYNKKVAEYNALVEELNPLVKSTKGLVEVYNEEINAYNACIGE